MAVVYIYLQNQIMSSHQQLDNAAKNDDNVQDMIDDRGVAATATDDEEAIKHDFRSMELQQQFYPWTYQEKFLTKQDSSDNLTATTALTSAFLSFNDELTLSSFEKSVTQKNNSNNRERNDWSNLQLNALQSMPSYLSFEKDSTATCPIQYTKKVLPRMRNLFRLLSLMVVYTNGSMYNEPYAICQDMDGVRFHVLLWRNNNKQNNHLELLVEVRYVGGESMLYHKRQYQYRILQSIHDSRDEATTEQSHVPTELSNLPIDPLLFNMKDREEQIAAQESLKRRIGDRTSHDEQINVIVDRIENFMCSEFIENVYEGLTILLNVTNANQSGFLVAETISKKLLTGTSMTSKMTLSLGLSECWYAEEELKNDDIRCDQTIIRDYSLLALRVIGQAVNFLNDETMQLFDINTETILKRDSFSSQSTLYQHIVHAEENPHFGYCAAHILARVCKSLLDIREEVQNDPECVPNIQRAVAFGLSNHISLELASKRLLSLVNRE